MRQAYYFIMTFFPIETFSIFCRFHWNNHICMFGCFGGVIIKIIKINTEHSLSAFRGSSVVMLSFRSLQNVNVEYWTKVFTCNSYYSDNVYLLSVGPWYWENIHIFFSFFLSHKINIKLVLCKHMRTGNYYLTFLESV